MTSPLTINVTSTPCRLASPHNRLVVVRNPGSKTVRVGDALVTPITGIPVPGGTTVQYRSPGAAVYLVAADPTTVEVSFFARERDVVSYDTGVPAELLDGRNYAELHASAARITAWKNS